MAKQLSMTLPDRVHAALTEHFKREFEQEPSEGLRTFLISAATCPQGATLNLTLPALATSPDPKQPELELGGALKA